MIYMRERNDCFHPLLFFAVQALPRSWRDPQPRCTQPAATTQSSGWWCAPTPGQGASPGNGAACSSRAATSWAGSRPRSWPRYENRLFPVKYKIMLFFVCRTRARTATRRASTSRERTRRTRGATRWRRKTSAAPTGTRFCWPCVVSRRSWMRTPPAPACTAVSPSSLLCFPSALILNCLRHFCDTLCDALRRTHRRLDHLRTFEFWASQILIFFL